MYRKTLLVLLEENNYVLLAWVKEKSSRRYNECRRRFRRPPATNETPVGVEKITKGMIDVKYINMCFVIVIHGALIYK